MGRGGLEGRYCGCDDPRRDAVGFGGGGVNWVRGGAHGGARMAVTFDVSVVRIDGCRAHGCDAWWRAESEKNGQKGCIWGSKVIKSGKKRVKKARMGVSATCLCAVNRGWGRGNEVFGGEMRRRTEVTFVILCAGARRKNSRMTKFEFVQSSSSSSSPWLLRRIRMRRVKVSSTFSRSGPVAVQR